MFFRRHWPGLINIILPMSKTLIIGVMIAVLNIFNSAIYAQNDRPSYAERLGVPKGAKVVIFHVDGAGMSVNSKAIEHMQPGVAMFIVHSTAVTDDWRKISHSGDSRLADMQAMMDPELREYIRLHGIIL